VPEHALRIAVLFGQSDVMKSHLERQPLITPALLQHLQTSENGLTSVQALNRLGTTGPNEPAAPERVGGVRAILFLLANPLVLILLIAAAISAFLGEGINAAIIVGIVLVGGAVNFVQSYRSQRALERLRHSVASTASVLRDGQWCELPRRQLVPGDIVRLTAGDVVPADARLLHSKDLHVQQAALTGESMPVEKEAHQTSELPTQLADRSDTVLMGTSVVSGTATAVVEATGRATAFGDIAARLAARVPETEFERGIRRFSFFIMQTVLFLVLFVFLVSIALRHNALETLLFVVALAVGLTPEFLPMIIAVTLAQGAVHMARKKVIVKHLAAMQNFGSMDILCSDKTGTLTSGSMALERKLDPLGTPCEEPFLLAYLNSLHETGIKSPLDAAILQNGHPDVAEYRKLDEIPFDFERRRLSVVVEKAGKRLVITKGSPPEVLGVCSAYELTGQSQALDIQARCRCQNTYQQLNTQGFRVLAVAYRDAPAQAAYRAADEQGLTLAGFLAFSDPVREDAADAISDLHHDGVQVKVITGDNDLVARHICEQVGLDVSRVVLGDDIDRMTDAALGHVAEQAAVFARVSPAQKNRIVLALKHRGHVVGFLGDGINDAPSLHAADVGISVGEAADVAKDAAEIILLEHSLRVLHSGIIEGRKAFGNVMKYLLMGTSSNFGNMFSMAAASLFLPFLPMLPVQVLLNNFLYDLAQVTIPTDRVDASLIHKPRRWDISLIRDFMLFVGPISSLFDFLTFAALLILFDGSEAHFHTGWFVESLVTQTLVLFIIRTAGNPFRSRPSYALTSTVWIVVMIGAGLPLTPLAPSLGFTAMPAGFYLFVIGVTASYLSLVEVVKRRLMRRLIL
jgi:Mg2+-importing ATPase